MPTKKMIRILLIVLLAVTDVGCQSQLNLPQLGQFSLPQPSQFSVPQSSQFNYWPSQYSSSSTNSLMPRLVPYKSNLSRNSQLMPYSYLYPTYGDVYTTGSILQPTGGGIEREDNNYYYSTYNAYNNQAAYPRNTFPTFSGLNTPTSGLTWPSSLTFPSSSDAGSTGFLGRKKK